MTFEWDEAKNQGNQEKHGVSFEDAQRVFADPRRYIEQDVKHSTPDETRFYCYGNVDGSVLTVRFTLRDEAIRIFGAGQWRGGKAIYENRQGKTQ